MVPEKVKEIFEQISSSVDNNDGNSFRDEDVEQITTDVFDLVSSILTAPEKNSGPDWENIQQRFTLTPKETEVATLVFEGYSNQEIADHLGRIAVNTVKQHVYRIFNKVGAENRTHFIYKLLEYKRA